MTALVHYASALRENHEARFSSRTRTFSITLLRNSGLYTSTAVNPTGTETYTANFQSCKQTETQW